MTPTGHLTIGSNNRYLLEDGKPFLWIGDTAWALPMTLTKPEAISYLDDAATRGFNMIQMFSDAPWALDSANHTKMGYPIYDNKDPCQLHGKHFQFIGWIIDQASMRGIYTLLTVGNPAVKSSYANDVSPKYYRLLTTDAELYTYGRKLGQFFRSRNRKMIWCLGQDEPFDQAPFKSGWNAMAEGIADGVNGADTDNLDGRAEYSSTLMAFHGNNSNFSTPSGAGQSHLKDLPWLDLYGTYANNKILHDVALENYALSPRKPAFGIETRYESRLDNYGSWGKWWKRRADVYGGDDDCINAHETRTHIYHTFQAGHMGYTYGHDEIYPFAPLPGYAVASSRGDWRSVLNAPGRRALGIAKAFYSSIPWYVLTPDQDLVGGGTGSGLHRIAAAYTDDGRYTTVYFPVDRVSREISFRRIDRSHAAVEAKWFDPSSGEYLAIGTYPLAEKQKSFTSPPGWRGAMLVLKGGKRGVEPESLSP